MSDRIIDIQKFLPPRPAQSAQFLTVEQRHAVASLIGYAEGVISSGILGEQAEMNLRVTVNNACNAFGLPTKAERVPS